MLDFFYESITPNSVTEDAQHRNRRRRRKKNFIKFRIRVIIIRQHNITCLCI